jgi:hypothetical protein
MPALTHAPSRKKIEKAILNKLKDIHAIKERLYTLRYDTTQPHEDTVRDVEVRTRHKKWHQRAQLDALPPLLIVLPPLGGGVWIYPSIHLQNLIHELKRLESGLVFLREEAWRNFEQSLNLPALGLAEGSLIKAIKGSLLHLPDPSQAFPPLVFYFPFPHTWRCAMACAHRRRTAAGRSQCRQHTSHRRGRYRQLHPPVKHPVVVSLPPFPRSRSVVDSTTAAAAAAVVCRASRRAIG